MTLRTSKGGRNEALFTSRRQDWVTPTKVRQALWATLGIPALDPATSSDNPMRALSYYTEREDGLSKSWHLDEGYVWMNPPYGRHLKPWCTKFANEVRRGAALVPARTDTRWWETLVLGATQWISFRRRLQFELSDTYLLGPAPFPSALVLYNLPLYDLAAELESLGLPVLCNETWQLGQ